MYPPQTQALMQGMEKGKSMLPSQNNPQGRAAAKNPWEGTIQMYCDGILQVASQLGDQGDAYRDLKVKLYKLAYELSKTNNEITELVEEGVST